MTPNDKKLLSQMIKAGKFNDDIIEFLRQKMEDDTKTMIKRMGNKYCLHPDNSPQKGTYGY